MNDREFDRLVKRIQQSDPNEREIWADAQTPLSDSLDASDAEDDPNPESAHNGRQTKP